MCPVKHWTRALKVILKGTLQKKKLLPVGPKTLRRRKKRKTLAVTKRYVLKRKRKKLSQILAMDNIPGVTPHKKEGHLL